MKTKQYRKLLLLLFLFIFISINVFAAAGGGGGGHSGGGGSSGGGDGGAIFYLIYYLFRIIFMLPFPFNIIVLAIVIFIIYKVAKSYQAVSGLNNIPNFNTNNTTSNYTNKQDKIASEFLTKNPAFNKDEFKQKVRTAFAAIQEAWMQQNLAKVRKWISDGIYQQFNTQFIMMQALEQVNEISNINIQKVYIDEVESDGIYDIMHVGIQYSMYDAFTSKKYTKLNDGGPLQALEFWSFIKKSGVKEKDLYHTNNCPNCGGNLPNDGGETAKCPYCSTITYLGDYDWVLAEITQADDYYNSNKKFEKQGKFAKLIKEQIGEKQDFSLQLLEDKSGNGYMQMMTALVKKKPEIARRFVSDKLFEKLNNQINATPHFVFNRLYLNHVTAFDYFKENGKDNIVIAIKVSSQKIINTNTNQPQYEYSIVAKDEVLIMSRDIGVGKPQGALYAHSCPSCGAPIKDTIDTTCSYCQAQLNSTKYEWIITDWMSSNEYNSFKKSSTTSFVVDKKIDYLEDMFNVRDYALNNILMMVAADGRITEEEINFVNTLAKKWNYDVNKIQGFLQLAKNNKLVIRMPQDAKQKQKIIALMEKAAQLDNTVTTEEQALLEQVRNM